MRRLLPLLVLCATLAAADADFLPMLDPQLSQWEKWLGPVHRDFEVPGYVRGKTAKEDPVLGLNNDPLKVLTTRQEGDETVLHITGQVFGALTTLASYENFHLKTEQRWGEKRWVPRVDKVRDNGILIFCVGEHGAQGKYWMRSQELQVQEGDIGDWWPLAGAMADMPIRTDDPVKTRVYDPKGKVTTVTARVWHGTEYPEKPFGEWNLIECYALDGHAVFRLNGRTVNVLLNSRYKEKGSTTEVPLRSGKIQIQSEAAECHYRRMAIRPIKSWPAEVAGDIPASHRR
ncbi:MAG: DUF1080 domain-containing protein [Verrucomicrobiota bacterium]